MEIIRLGLEHLSELAPLFSGYRRFYEHSPDAESEHRYLAERIRRAECVIFLARDETRAVGFVLLYPTFDSVTLGPTWVLHDLFVSADHRKKGIGRSLMTHAHEYCRKQGAHRVDLATEVTNSTAQPLYESMGYKRDNDFYFYSLALRE